MNFLYPVPPSSIVTQTYAEHVHRAQVNGWQYYYGGIDWAVATGTPLKAAQAGKIVDVRSDATGYGVHVRIQHADGYLTIYGHMMDVSVQVGQTVNAGDVIGRSDNTGNSTGPHLHFELRRNNVPMDPGPLLVTSLDGSTGDEDGGDSGDTSGGTAGIGKPPKTWPKMPKARVVSTVGVNVRQGPGIGNPTVGYVPMNTEVEVIRQVKQGGDIWLQIGNKQFVAQLIGGQILVVWL